MKSINVTVPWKQGLHLRAASRVFQVARNFRSQIQLQLDSTVADAGSVLSMMLLSAGLGSQLSVHAYGDDEHEAIRALQNVFAGPGIEESEVTFPSEIAA